MVCKQLDHLGLSVVALCAITNCSPEAGEVYQRKMQTVSEADATLEAGLK